jgi:hypothetical protein
MDGGAERRLNVGAFLRFLQSEHFRNVQCIFIPCRKTKSLFVNDIKQACPSVQTIVRSKWLMINGSMEEMQEGEGQHPCYRVYRHDMPFTEGTNVWVQYELPWSESLSLNIEEILICPSMHASVCPHGITMGVLKASIVLKFLLYIYVVFLFAKPIF